MPGVRLACRCDHYDGGPALKQHWSKSRVRFQVGEIIYRGLQKQDCDSRRMIMRMQIVAEVWGHWLTGQYFPEERLVHGKAGSGIHGTRTPGIYLTGDPRDEHAGDPRVILGG